MNTYDDDLASLIKKTIGVAKGEPTELQLQKIKSDLQDILRSGKTPSTEDLEKIVFKYCQSGYFVSLESADNSDLKTILMLALQATPQKRT